MDDKVRQQALLLDQLRIDREDVTDRSAVMPPGLLMGALIALFAIVIGMVIWKTMPGPVVVKTAIAREIGSVPGTQGLSALDASGYVVARRQATVSSKTTGKIIEVLVEEGQPVERGQVIARLDDSNARIAYKQASAELARAEANLLSTKQALENAKPIFHRNRLLAEKGIISEHAYDAAKSVYDSTAMAVPISIRTEEIARAAAEAARQNLEDTIIRAPHAGVVTVKAAQAGEVVSPISAGGGFTRTGIGTIVDMDSLEIEVDVSENFINRVHVKQAASVRLNAYPDWDIPAEVVAVIPTANRAKATMKVRIGLGVKDPRILPEMSARVAFLESPVDDKQGNRIARSAVLVPADAVEVQGRSGVVFVVSDSIVERRVVRLGEVSDEGQLVLSGISVGEHLVTGGLEKMTDKARVRVEL